MSPRDTVMKPTIMSTTMLCVALFLMHVADNATWSSYKMLRTIVFSTVGYTEWTGTGAIGRKLCHNLVL